MHIISGHVKYVNSHHECMGFAGKAWIQVYFKSVNENSSESKWSAPIQINEDGSYSIDIEEIFKELTYSVNDDKIYLAYYWNDNNESNTITRASYNITHLAFIDHLLVDEEKPINVVMIPPMIPSTIFKIKKNFEAKKITLSEISRPYDYTLKEYNCGYEYITEVKQPYIYDGIKIFSGFRLKQTRINWDDGSHEVVIDKINNNELVTSSHVYEKSLDKYRFTFRVYNDFGLYNECIDFKEYKVDKEQLFYRSPFFRDKWRLDLFSVPDDKNEDENIVVQVLKLSLICSEGNVREFTRLLYDLVLKKSKKSKSYKNPFVVKYPSRGYLDISDLPIYCETKEDVIRLFENWDLVIKNIYVNSNNGELIVIYDPTEIHNIRIDEGDNNSLNIDSYVNKKFIDAWFTDSGEFEFKQYVED